ncbi:melatonin receptor type 1C-like [Protopterus annectens]|uniref:melatonin receptor type 1C-like n=1 Tax=Protopterus annectens TaxID=7888 RepID=UPI001CFA2712|nr:melatonin receptor type 1C-like [Protopterus annectens]
MPWSDLNFSCYWPHSNNNSNKDATGIYYHTAAIGVLVAVMMFTIVMDLTGNVLVILSIVRNKKLRTTGNYFVINLALADLLVAVYPYPTILVALFQNGWTLGETQCRLSAALICLSCIASVYNITAIAINRYCCICHASRYNLLFSEKNTYTCIGSIWVLSVITFLPMVFYNMLHYDPRIYQCTFLRSVNLSITLGIEITHFFVSTSIVIFCYTKIWIMIIEVKFRVRKQSKQKLKSNELQQFFIMFLVFALFSVCWGPYSVIGFAIAIGPMHLESSIPCWVYPVSSFLAAFNSCLNGILYGVFNQNFRNEYKRFIFYCVCLGNCDPDSDSAEFVPPDVRISVASDDDGGNIKAQSGNTEVQFDTELQGMKS